MKLLSSKNQSLSSRNLTFSRRK